MPFRRSWMNRRLSTIGLLLILPVLAFPITCSTSLAGPRLLTEPHQRGQLSLLQAAPSGPVSTVLIPAEELLKLQEFARKCYAFAGECRERVALLESYKTESDKQIKQQEERVYICNGELNAEKKKKKFIIPAALLGVIVGIVAF